MQTAPSQYYEICYPAGDFISWQALRLAMKAALTARIPDPEGIDRILGERRRYWDPSRDLDFMLPGTRGLSEEGKVYYASLLPDLPPLTKGMTAEEVQRFLNAYRTHPSTDPEREPWLLHPLDIEELRAQADKELENYEAQLNKEIQRERLTGRQMSTGLFPYVLGRTLHLDPQTELPRNSIIQHLEILGFVSSRSSDDLKASSKTASAQRLDQLTTAPQTDPPKRQRDDAIRRLMKDMGILAPLELNRQSLAEFSSKLLLQMIKRVEEGAPNQSLKVWKGHLYCTRLRNPSPWPDHDNPVLRDWTLVDVENVRARLARLTP